LCFSENFCWQTKNIHNFFGDNTRFTPGIEAWSRATQKMGFRMDTGKFNFERKRVWPHTDPWSQRLVVQINQKNITRLENPSNSYIISCFNNYFKKVVQYRMVWWLSRSLVKSKVARSIHAPCNTDYDTTDVTDYSDIFGWGSFPKVLFLLDKIHPQV